MRFAKRRSPKRRSAKCRSLSRCSSKLRFEALESRHLLSGSPLSFDDGGLAPAGLQAICALPNLPVFNVLNYGATGNGVTDDTVAIRGALAAAEAAGGGIIYLPAGTYAVDPQASDPVTYGSIFNVTSSNIVFIGDHDPVTGATETHLNGYVLGMQNPTTHWQVIGQPGNEIGRFDMFTLSNYGGSLSNVQFRSLDINGDAGFTGNSQVGGDPATGDGWDLNHKAILMDGDHTNITSVLVFNCDIRNWRGEEVYGGGNQIGTVDIVKTFIRSSNASAISCSGSVTVDDCTVGGSGSDRVYNGLENFCFNGQFTDVTDSLIQYAGNGLVLSGEPTATFSVTGTTFTHNDRGILFSEGAHNVIIDGNTFENNTNAMMTTILGTVPGFPTGFSDFTISNNTFDSTGAAFYSQNYGTTNQDAFPNLVLDGNTVTHGELLQGGFGGPLGSWTGFVVENTTIGSGGGSVQSYAGDNIALWSNTTYPAVGTTDWYYAPQPITDYSGNTSTTISFLSDLTILGNNITPGLLSATIDPSALGGFPIGFTTTVFQVGATNWILKANPTWNTFSSDLPIGPSGLTIQVDSRGLFEVVDPTSGGTTSTGTTTALTSSASTSASGQAVTFTAIVSANTPGAGTPTGNVTFVDGSTTLGTAALDANGKATFTTSILSVGSHAIQVSYGGDANFTASTGNLTQTVNQADPSTTVSVASTAPSAVFGQSLTFTASVTSSTPGVGVPTGNVTFVDGSTILGTVALDATGEVTFITSTIAAGSHTIQASYSGDAAFAASSSSMTQTVNPASTSTAAISSASPSLVGQSVTFTATVIDAMSAMPTGNVTFFDGTTTIGTGTLDSTGHAKLNTSALAVGIHTIKVLFGGSASFSASSAQFTQMVAKSTTTTLTSSAHPSVFGQAVTFTATVKAGTSPVTTGYVTFLDGGSTLLGYGSLNSKGIATLKTSTLVVGIHPITASYSGSTSFATSACQISQTVNLAATTTAIASSASTSVFGQWVTFTATLTTKSPGTGIPTGIVTFLDGGSALGTGVLNATGKATFSTSALAVGSHVITAYYGGSANQNVSSAKLTQAVKGAATITAISSSASSSAFGQWVTFTATVTAKSPSSAIPTGAVRFFDGTTVIGIGAVDATGKATFTTASLAIGTHTITASFVATPCFAASSAKLTQAIGQATVTAAVSSSANASFFGQAVTFTAGISANAAGSLVPTGSVVFLDGNNILGTSTLDSAGTATFTTSALSAGVHVITVSYTTTGKNYKTTTLTMTQTVNQAITTTTLTSSANPSVLGQPMTFTAAVVAVAPGSGIPVGKVTFFDGSTALATVLLDASGNATFTTLALDAGDHVITASYAGVPNFAASGDLLTQSVILPS